MKIPLVVGDKVEQTDFRDALTVNTLTVMKPIHGVAGYMTSHDGLATYGPGKGRDRGAIYNERLKQHLRVSGDKLIRVDHTGSVGPFDIPVGGSTAVGDIPGEDNKTFSQAAMQGYSFNTQGICTDGRFWLYDGTTLTEVTDPNLGKPIDQCWLGGYYVMTDGEYLFHTTLPDEYQIDPDNYATNEISPDPTLGVARTTDNQLMAFDRYTTGYFQNTGNPDGFAFTYIQSKSVKKGIIGTHLKTEMNGQFFCLGSGKEEAPTMLIIHPGGTQNFSTREVDKILSEYTEEEMRDNGVMECRIDDRSQLVYLRLPNHTLCYNHVVAQQLGLQAAWSLVTSGVETETPWYGANGVLDIASNRWMYGNRWDQRLGVLNSNKIGQYDEDSETIFYSPFINLKTQSIDMLEIETIPGFSLENVTVFVSLTYNGRTYGKEWSVKYGEPSNYSTRFIARRMGYVSDWIGFKFRVTGNNSKVAFANMIINENE